MSVDRYQRKLEDLRISVTDRCNFRCTYCMPHEEYEWLARDAILSFEEVVRVARVFVGLGVRNLRLTGGEPLLRKNLPDLVSQLSAIEGIEDLALTTNGGLLVEQAEPLRTAGITRLNISVDTLDAEKFRRMAQRDELDRVLAGIEAARTAGFSSIKINTVVEKGQNEDEIPALVEFCRERGLSLRFIEYMDVGNSNAWCMDKVVTKAEILAAVHRVSAVESVGHRERESDPATLYRFRSGDGDVGVIASVTEPFCSGCTRARITADGHLVTCLFGQAGLDLKALLRGGATDEQIRDALTQVWTNRTDRFSQERLTSLRSGDGYRPDDHDKIEMIKLGG